MFPVRDTVVSRRPPVVTRLLLILNVLAFIWQLRQGHAMETAVYRFGVVPAHWIVSTWSDFLDWPQLFLTLVTSQFLHGSFLHVGFNMWYLWIFADNVEDRLGHLRFLILYLGCGVAAAVSQLLVTPHSAIPMIGASGAIAGVLGAYLLMFPTARIVTLVPLGISLETIELPAALFLALWFLLQWVQGVASIGHIADVGGVAFWAHIGGFIAGMLGVALMRPRRGW